jgi:phosphoglycolate phosphatase-like HAD superfamily hydrolase
MHRLVMKSRTHLLKRHPCLALVARLNVPSEIVTSSLAAFAQMVLGAEVEHFVHIRGHETATKGSLMRTLSRNAIFITDTVVDVKRCQDHGLAVIAVAWGYDTSVALRHSQPDFLVESSAELESLLEELELLRVA